MPPPFDPHGMPHPRPGPGPMMGEPWFDRMPAPPKGFNHHPFPPPFPPDHFQGHMGARDYRGGGGGSRGGEGRGVYFNDMADPHPHLFDMDFHNGPSNSQLSNSDGMSSGGNYLLPLDHQMHTDSTKVQSTSCRYTYCCVCIINFINHSTFFLFLSQSLQVTRSSATNGGGKQSSRGR